VQVVDLTQGSYFTWAALSEVRGIFGSHAIKRSANSSPISWVFAVVRLAKDGRLALLAPNFSPGPAWVLSKMRVPFVEITINCPFRLFHRGVITIVNYCPSHVAEDGLDHVHELSTSRQWCGFDQRTASTGD
jgi:hypothetical protein